MGQKALAAAEVFVTELGLEGQLTPQQFLVEREAALDALFPTATLLPGTRFFGCACRSGVEKRGMHSSQRARWRSPSPTPCVHHAVAHTPPTHAGAERLLRHLRAHGVPFCLATSSHARHYELKTTSHRCARACLACPVPCCAPAACADAQSWPSPPRTAMEQGSLCAVRSPHNGLPGEQRQTGTRHLPGGGGALGPAASAGRLPCL